MKELVVLSGKGGTGKTSIAAALASLAEKVMLVDCDVDAADLHLLLCPTVNEEIAFSDSSVAHIDREKCVKCGYCFDRCRFDAVSTDFVVDPLACEGCGVCVKVCPNQAIQFYPKVSGRWFVSDTRYGPMVHARLHPGEGNSGKLVAVLRNHARQMGRTRGVQHILVDGPPGIGCPVISALTGSDAVLVVTEPTISGLHDFERVSELVRHFKLREFVCVNKAEVNPELAGTIEARASEFGAEVVARIGYDTSFTDAQLEGKTITEYSNSSPASVSIRKMWDTMKTKLSEN